MPITLLLLAAVLVTTGEFAFTKWIDELTWVLLCDGGCARGARIDTLIIMLLPTAIVAFSLYPHEYDSGTINFLKALPISETKIFVAKFVAGLIVLVGISAISHIIGALLLLPNPSSLSSDSNFWLSFQFFVSSAITSAIVLAYCMFLSPLRWYGLIVVPLLLAGLGLIERFGIVSIFNPVEMFRIDYYGQSLVMPWPALLMHSGIALLALLITAKHWKHANAWGQVRQQSGRLKTWGKVLGIGFVFVIVMAATANRVDNWGGQADQGRDVDTIRTQNFNFLYPVRARATAEKLGERADRIYSDVAEYLGADVRPRVRANLTAESQHFAGLARWKTIWMDIARPKSPHDFELVLAHEVAHVFQGTESRRGLRDFVGSVQFFVEGSAEFVANEVLENQKNRELNWRLAAASASIGELGFEDLVNANLIKQDFGPELFYGLGDLWTVALVNTCGNQMVGNVIRTFRDKKELDAVRGVGLWSKVLEAHGCSLIDVNAAWNAHLAKISSDDSANYPDKGTLTVCEDSAQYYKATLLLESPHESFTKGSFAIRLKKEQGITNTPERNFFGTLDAGTGKVTFRIPRNVLATSRFDYKIIWNPDGGSFPLIHRSRTGHVGEMDCAG